MYSPTDQPVFALVHNTHSAPLELAGDAVSSNFRYRVARCLCSHSGSVLVNIELFNSKSKSVRNETDGITHCQ
jgi:hypothetical protein